MSGMDAILASTLVLAALATGISTGLFIRLAWQERKKAKTRKMILDVTAKELLRGGYPPELSEEVVRRIEHLPGFGTGYNFSRTLREVILENKSP